MSKPNPATADCDTDPNAISVARAQQIIAQTITPLTQTETIPTRNALARIAAADIKSPAQVPNHTNSAMDGYALRAEDLSNNTNTDPIELRVIGNALAGKPFTGEVARGQCIRIMTGAVLPRGTDSVVIQERVTRKDNPDTISISPQEKPHANIRQAGEDIQIGDTVITRGTRLNPSHLGLAASLGLRELPVIRHPRVAIFSNGDELRALDDPNTKNCALANADSTLANSDRALALGELYDSNRYTLTGMLQAIGAEIIDLGIIPDDARAIDTALQKAAESADIVITSAGASVGEADYIAACIRRHGELKFWKVAIKPGRPLAFGTLRNSLFFGLPGNPVSVMVTFQVFVKPALRHLAGESSPAVQPLRLLAKTLSPLKKRRGRTEYQRGILTTETTPTITHTVRTTGEQGSGILRSMGDANCFILLPSACAAVPRGEVVEVEPFGEMW